MLNLLISVIVPVYNSEKYLNRCVESLVNQTYKNLEIILVDDGSPDNSPKMCDEWAEKDSRIKIIHKENGGALSARIEGVNISSGDYIAFVDSDDWLEPDAYSYLADITQRYNSQVSCFGMRDVDINDEITDIEKTAENIKIYNFTDIIKYMNEDSLWSMCNKIYKKDLLSALPEMPLNLAFSEDFLFNYFVYKNTEKLIVSNQIKYNYFRHEQSAIAGCITYKLIDDSMKAYKIIDDDFDKALPAYKFQAINKVKNDFFLINSVIRNQKCLDRYETLRKDILKYKKFVFSKECRDSVAFRHKFGVLLLMLAPKIYDETILVRRKIRGY